MPFRTAHGVSAGLVRISIEKNCRLEELDFSEYQAASPLFEKDIFDLITPEKCVEIRKTIGGPAPSEVQKQIEKLSDFVKQNTSKGNDPIGDFIN
jgi:argininosuccinate lyase